VSIVALPKPRCANEQALALYATALQAMRDANWSRAAEHLRAAAALEPTCAMIQLRLAQATDGAEQAASYARAVDGRTQMSPRDRALLEIWGAFLQTPPDVARAVARMQEAVKAFPGDAELFDHLCARAPGAEIAAAACKKATELDPDYADAWSDLGAHLHSLGRDDEALRAYERCVGLSPATSECQSGRAAIYAERGACAAAERDRRAVAEANPRSYSAHYAWAVSLDAIDAPREAVHVALHEAIALLPDDERAFNARLAEANAASDDDDGETAERKLAEAERALGEHPTPENREHVALARVVAALDAGRFKEAGEIAAAFQARWPGWAGARTSWSEPALDYARFRAGAIDRPALEAARADWDARIRRDAPEMHTAWQRWMITYYGMIDDPEDAERALAAAPHDSVTTPFSRLRVADEEAIAGHAARALRAFEATDASCPVRRALGRSVERGLAFEQTGARAEACALYARMTSATHAGKAPATLRGKVAAEHAKKLGCK
jgi:Flp pilus assembly protein TadD